MICSFCLFTLFLLPISYPTLLLFSIHSLFTYSDIPTPGLRPTGHTYSSLLSAYATSQSVGAEAYGKSGESCFDTII